MYIDLTAKGDTELVNLAIVTLEIEDDFVSFELNKFIVMLYDYDLITTKEYNEYVYGTIDQRKIELTKIGLNIGLINKLEADGQLKNIFLDEYNNLKANTEFNEYKNSANDFYRFELRDFSLILKNLSTVCLLPLRNLFEHNHRDGFLTGASISYPESFTFKAFISSLTF